MSELALLVLLDAFRPDYLERTRFLSQLALRSGVGEMEEPFGFVPRAAYFGGLAPNDSRYSNIFALEPSRSPFPSVPGAARVGALVGDELLRARISAEAKWRVPDFGSRYAEAFRVPTPDLASFAITEVDPPWGPAAGYLSLFNILDAAGLKWVQCSWPYTRTIEAMDPGIVGRFAGELSPDTRFGFVHLSLLDAVGHVHGPGSREMQRALNETDRLCEWLYAHAQERFDRVRMLAFGDHGMVTVVRTVDLLDRLLGEPLVRGRDYTLFLDSPMARFWFHTSGARARIERFLAGLDCGGILTEQDLTKFGAEQTARGNGDLFFMAHPGVVFAPNCFQAESETVRGMHGYLPSVPDNRGMLLLHDSAARTAGRLGVVEARRLFPTCLEMCGLDSGKFTPLPPLTIVAKHPHWTPEGSITHEARVDRDIEEAARIIAERAPASAVTVTGSFGRAEGGVLDSPNGPRVLNDYDFAVIGPDAWRCQSPPMGEELARRLGTDFCDVLSFVAPASLSPSQLHFDLRYGSRIVAGDPLALERLPEYAPEDVTADDALLLLINRIAGVCLVPLPEQAGAAGALGQFAVNQLVKAWLAVADTHLIARRDYSASYRRRRERFAALAPALGVESSVASCIDRAFAYKLSPAPPPASFDARDFVAWRPACRAALVLASGRDAKAGRARGVEMAMAPVIDPAADDALVRREIVSLGWQPLPKNEAAPSLRRAILEGIVSVFFAGDGVSVDAHELEEARERLRILGAPMPDASGSAAVESSRKLLAAAWLHACH